MFCDKAIKRRTLSMWPEEKRGEKSIKRVIYMCDACWCCGSAVGFIVVVVAG